MPLVLHTIPNNAASRLVSDRAQGGTSLVLETGKGALFGSPTSSAPVYISLFLDAALDSFNRVIDTGGYLIAEVTGRTDDTLTIGSLIEGTDRLYPAGSEVYAFVLGQHFAELQNAALDHESRLLGIETGGGGGGGSSLPDQTGHDGQWLRTNGTAPAWSAIAAADVAGLGTMASKDAADYYDQAGTDGRIGEAILPLLPTATANATFAPINHTHLIADVSGLQTALDAKAADSGVVHLAGAETITGEKTHTGAFYVTRNGGANLVFRALTDGNGCYMGDRLSVNGLTAIPSAGGIELASGAGLVWTGNPASSGGTKDTGLVRDSAGILKVTDGSTGLGQIKASGELLTGIPLLLFSQTADKVVTGTTLETSLVGTGLGSLTIPANALTLGKTYRLTAWGLYTVPASTSGTTRWWLKIGSSIVCTVQATHFASQTDFGWRITGLFTVRSVGVSGSVRGHASLDRWYNSGAANQVLLSTSDTTIDTTTAQTVDLTVRPNATDLVWSATNLILESLN